MFGLNLCCGVWESFTHWKAVRCYSTGRRVVLQWNENMGISRNGFGSTEESWCVLDLHVSAGICRISL